jgi:AbrB family looped-hinge helix DNA binding protein
MDMKTIFIKKLKCLNQLNDIFLTLDVVSLQKDNILTMRNISTITSKRQLTIPAEIFNAANLKTGEKLTFTLQEDGSILLKSPLAAIEKLSGSVQVPEELKGKDLKEVRLEAIKIHFSERGENNANLP